MDDVKVNNRLGHVHAGNHLPTSPLDGVIHKNAKLLFKQTRVLQDY